MKSKKDNLFVTIPTWRAIKDVTIAEDIVEEVARFYGYNNIPAELPSLEIKPAISNPLRDLEKKIANVLVKEMGYCEVYNYSFVGEAQITKLGDNLEKYLELDNPLSKERPYMRRNLLPNLLENIKNNIENYSIVKIFEIGKVFSVQETGVRADNNGDSLLPRQDTWLAAMYAAKKDETPYWQARRALESVCNEINFKFTILPADKIQPWEHPTRLALVSVMGQTVGVVCEINPIVSSNLGIEQRVSVLQLNLSALSELMSKQKNGSNYKTTSQYPEVVRDLAFLVKKEVEHSQILASLLKLSPIITNIELFDVYEGTKIGEGYKSMGYSITLSDPKATLITVEVDVIMKNVQKVLEEKFGAEMR